MKLTFSPFFSRPVYGMRGLECLNVYAEQTPYGPTMFGRPGKVLLFTAGDGPVRGVYRAPGVNSDKVMVVSGQGFYVKDQYKGPIAGTGPVQFAASAEQVVVVGGGNAYWYSTFDATLRQITDPDLPQVSGVVYLNGRFYFQELGTDKVWFSAEADATSIDGLAFESAESKPDATVAMAVRGDTIAFLGQNSYELWAVNQGSDAAITPLIPIETFRFDKGCASQATVVNCDNSIFFVGADAMVYRCDGGVPLRISDFGIDERLKASSDLSKATAFTQSLAGHLFYIVNIPGQGTFVFDVATKLWFQWAAWESDYLGLSCGIMNGADSYCGDDTTGQVWALAAGASDNNGVAIVCMVSAYAPLECGVQRCDVIGLDVVRGLGHIGRTDMAEMRYSGDGGQTWSAWKPRTLGRLGDTTARATWRSLGLIRSPGRIIQFRSANGASFIVHGMTIGDQRP